MSTKPAPLAGMSMKWVRYEDGSYGVDLQLYGLESEQQAEAAMEHMQRLFCSHEIKQGEMQ